MSWTEILIYLGFILAISFLVIVIALCVVAKKMNDDIDNEEKRML